MTNELERRAVWLVALSGLLLTFGQFGFEFGANEAWSAALFVAKLAALVASVGLAVLALAPMPIRTRLLADPERRLFWGFALLAVALLITAVRSATDAIRYIGEPPF